jgi:hypothetical protein
VTTAYDSEEGVFVNKVSCKLAGDLAKLRLSFQSDPQGQWQGGGEEGDPLQQLFTAPLVGLSTKHFSLLYDVEARNTLLTGDCFLPGGAVRLRASHDVKVLRRKFDSRNGFTIYLSKLSRARWVLARPGTRKGLSTDLAVQKNFSWPEILF